MFLTHAVCTKVYDIITSIILHNWQSVAGVLIVPSFFFWVKLEQAIASVKCTRGAHEIGKRKYVNQPVNYGKSGTWNCLRIYIFEVMNKFLKVVQCLDAATSVSQQYTNVKQIKIQLSCTIQNNR